MPLAGFLELIRNKTIKCSAVIVAAGSSERFGSDKTLAPLLGTPVLAYSLMVFNACKYVKEIVVVTSTDKIEAVAKLCDNYNISKAAKIVCGGNTRAESALSGVSEVSNASNLIAVHDAARPLITTEIISKAIESALSNRAVAVAIPSKDTVKIAINGSVLSTPERDTVRLIQTPQVFEPNILKAALTNALIKELRVTDDASAVEALGFKVFLTEGSEENIKITTPQDMKLAETILLNRRVLSKNRNR